MYLSSFYITNPVWNNVFSYEKRQNKKLHVPFLTKATSFDDITLWEEIVFEDYDFDDKLQSCKWLKNFYEFDYNWIPLYLFDNHNHAYFFWYKAKKEWYINDNTILYHIDEHADTRDPWVYLWKNSLDDLQKVFDYTNFTLNVGNYIIPAIKDGLIKEVIQIRSETELNNLKEKMRNDDLLFTSDFVIPSAVEKSGGKLNNENLENNVKCKVQIPPLQSEWQEEKIVNRWQDIILNIDLDFFQPDLDFIDYNLKKEVVQRLAKKASVITVATSPFFIDQKLALKAFKDLFF